MEITQPSVVNSLAQSERRNSERLHKSLPVRFIDPEYQESGSCLKRGYDVVGYDISSDGIRLEINIPEKNYIRNTLLNFRQVLLEIKLPEANESLIAKANFLLIPEFLLIFFRIPS
jgi:hypothetical protein